MDLVKAAFQKSIYAACGCHMGKRRKNNEDNFFFHGTYLTSDNQGLSDILWKKTSFLEGIFSPYLFYGVFDGMGGGAFGEVASQTAAEAASNFLKNKDNINFSDITPSLTNMCRTMNQRVFETGVSLGTDNMGTTIASLFFYAGQVWACNIGDSRCYRMRHTRMEQLSEDHTDAECMEQQGITGRKPYLTQYLGINPEELRIEPYVRNCQLQRNDRFLLCSDGLTDMVSEQEICNILEKADTPEAGVRKLIEAALEAGGKDNITVIVCQAG